MYVYRSPAVYESGLNYIKISALRQNGNVVRVMKIHKSAGSKLFLKLVSYNLITSQILTFNEVLGLTGREGNLRAQGGSSC
jgi:hypothetical protein